MTYYYMKLILPPSRVCSKDDHPPPLQQQQDQDDVESIHGNNTTVLLFVLCEECRAVVQRASPVNLSYVPIENPHPGGRFPNGSMGCIIDVTHLKNHPPFFNWTQHREEVCTTVVIGTEKAQKGGDDEEDDQLEYQTVDEIKRVIKNRTIEAQSFFRAQENSSTLKQPCKQALPKKPYYDYSPSKILCIVYTIEPHHASKIPPIRETWGPQCDGFFVASNATDLSMDVVAIPHVGPEIYKNIWQKVRAIWSYVYHHYYDDFDWFHIGGDDLWVIVDNLRAYLDSDEIRLAANYHSQKASSSTSSTSTLNQQTPLFLGARICGRPCRGGFNSGGPGYTLNKASLKLLATNLPHFFQNVQAPHEDVLVTRMLDKLGVDKYPTEDEEQRYRYNTHQPGNWLVRRERPTSPSSVAFHFVGLDRPKNEHQMRRLHAMLNDLC